MDPRSTAEQELFRLTDDTIGQMNHSWITNSHAAWKYTGFRLNNGHKIIGASGTSVVYDYLTAVAVQIFGIRHITESPLGELAMLSYIDTYAVGTEGTQATRDIDELVEAIGLWFNTTICPISYKFLAAFCETVQRMNIKE